MAVRAKPLAASRFSANAIYATRFTPGPQYQGPPGVMHGGLVTTLADEIAAWTIVALKGRFGFTVELHARLSKPVRIGVELEATGRLEKDGSRIVKTAVELHQAGPLCFRGLFTFALLDQAAAARVLGGPLPEVWRLPGSVPHLFPRDEPILAHLLVLLVEAKKVEAPVYDRCPAGRRLTPAGHLMRRRMRGWVPGVALTVALFGLVPRSGHATPPGSGTTAGIGTACGPNDVLYFAAGCEGPAQPRCWNGNIHPTPMEFCGCDGRTASAPLPGGGHRWRAAGACPAAPPTTPQVAVPPVVGAPMNVSTWLMQCAVAPRNGLNPQLAVPAGMVDAGRPELLAAVARAPQDQRRCAAWVLSRNVPPRELHAFWRKQLASSHDAQVRWYALYSLSEVADPKDLELVFRQHFECPPMRAPLASWLRNWKDRRVMPALAALLAQAEPEATRRNALYSMVWLHFAPELPPDPDPKHGPPGQAPDSTAAPYRRWWQSEGQHGFAAEQQQWNRLASDGKECLPPHREQPRWGLDVVTKSKRNRTDRSHIGGHSFPAQAVATRGGTRQNTARPDYLQR